MKFKADLHIHTDHDPIRDRWHGDRPERIAKAIVDSDLDLYAITEHNQVSERFFEVAEIIEELTDGVRREIVGRLGVEMTVMFDGYRYHIGYIFEDNFTRHNMPDVPPSKSDIKVLEHYQQDYPGLVILNHPTWKDHGKSNRPDVTAAFIESGLVDGVEILNSSILQNGADSRITKTAIELFLEARRKGIKVAAIASSDAHVGADNGSKISPVGTVATGFHAASIEDFDRTVKSGRTEALVLGPDALKKKVRGILRQVPGGNKYIHISR